MDGGGYIPTPSFFRQLGSGDAGAVGDTGAAQAGIIEQSMQFDDVVSTTVEEQHHTDDHDMNKGQATKDEIDRLRKQLTIDKDSKKKEDKVKISS